MKNREKSSAKAQAEVYCRSMCDAYAAGAITDEHMELLVDEVLELHRSVAPPLWAKLGRLPLDSARRILASCGEAGGLSAHTMAWLMAFVERGEAGLIGRALEAMESYIIHIAVTIPESIPLNDGRRILARRGFQRFYHRSGTAKFVWASLHATPSTGTTESESTVLAGSFDSIVASL